MSETYNPFRFNWYLKGKIAASAYPGRFFNLSHDLDQLKAQKVRVIINLHDPIEELPPEYREHLEVINEPVLDCYPPSEEQMHDIIAHARKAIGEKKACVVCCRGGIGRTATITAILLMEIGGFSLEEALGALRQDGRMPQSLDQHHFIVGWAEKKKKEKPAPKKAAAPAKPKKSSPKKAKGKKLRS